MPLAFFYFNPFYYDWMYFAVFIPVFLLGLIAQGWLKSRYRRFAEIPNAQHLTGADAARQILRAHGIDNVRVEEIPGDLSDNYNSREKVVHLSTAVYHGRSLSAVGIAAHECGHAIQDAEHYAMLKLRHVMGPAVQLGSGFYMILFIIAFYLLYSHAAGLAGIFATAGLACLALLVAFSLVTLPVEFDASFRAMKELRGLALLDEEELTGVRKVLTAAAMTYVVGAVGSIATLLYFYMRFRGRD